MARDPIAFHEAGHVVVGHLLGLRLLDTDILRDGEGGNGHTHFADPGTTKPERDFVERLLTTFMAGFAAESLAGLADPEGSGYDRDQAVRRWAAYLAPSGPEQDRLLEQALQRAGKLLGQPAAWAAVEAVAKALSERKRLSGATAAGIVGRFGLPPGAELAS